MRSCISHGHIPLYLLILDIDGYSYRQMDIGNLLFLAECDLCHIPTLCPFYWANFRTADSNLRQISCY